MTLRIAASATLFAALVAPPLATFADDSGVPNASEAPFVATVSKDLTSRFATTEAAVRAGYERYTDEDDSGAISYANRMWTSADATHPSQLWYDANGRLIGADYSVPLAGAVPKRFGLEPSRWQTFHAHEHYGLVGPGDATTYGSTSAKKVAAAGGDPANPTAADLVKLGVAKKASDVRFVFEFPAIWDVSLWVLPNKNGAFADKNPAVMPKHAAKDMGM